MQTINKKIILGTALGIVLLIGLIYTSKALEITVNDVGTVLQFEVIFPSYLTNLIRNVQGVISVNNLPYGTEIIVNRSINVDGQLVNYLEGLERSIQENTDRLALYPDNQPPPLCLVDVVTREKIGYYSVNRVMFAVANDTRCP